MATIRFCIKTTKKNKNALVPIYVRVRAGKKIDLTIKADILVKPDNWSNETQQARQRADIFRFKSGESEDEKTGRQKFNDKINGLRRSIELEMVQMRQAEITNEWLRSTIDKYWNPDKFNMTLFNFTQNFIEKAETRSNPKTRQPVCYKMRREYEVTFKYLKDYAKESGKVVDFKTIDLEFYDGFTEFLRGKKLALNTIGKKIQTLKIFLNAAKEEGKNNYEGYKSKKFVVSTEKSESIYLTELELDQIYKLDLSKNPGLDQVRDLFLVGCWTGCRFSDIGQIIPENVSGGFIRMTQHKTNKGVVIPLHPVVTSIMNKYDGVLPEVISNQKFNMELKVIARKAKLTEKTHKAITKGGVKVSTAYEKWQLVTTHTARRSFATNLYKSDFPSLSIMAITGHVTEKSFLKYIKITPDEHAKKLQLHWDRRHLKIV